MQVPADEKVQALIKSGQQLLSRGYLRAAKQKFDAAMDVLAQNYKDAVVGFCVNRGFGAQGEDVAQDVFLAVYKTIPHFRHEASIRTWIFAIVRNVCRDLAETIKRDGLEADHESRGRLETVGERTDAEPQDMLARRFENRDFLRRGLALLPDDDREILLLQALEGLTTQGIADIWGLSPAAVRTRLTRARVRFREILERLQRSGRI
jgi:RNA polymerase sigma-70 factor (ECF subfamily)